jgi:hypothetical protein
MRKPAQKVGLWPGAPGQCVPLSDSTLGHSIKVYGFRKGLNRLATNCFLRKPRADVMNDRPTNLAIAGIFLATWLCGCATPTTAVYKLYPGPVKPDSEISTLHLHNASNATIDGISVSRRDYSIIQLSPGEHQVRWTSVHGVSVLIERSGFAEKKSAHKVDLKRGHNYRLRSDRTTGHGYIIYHWIEDVDTGEVVAGTEKP